MKPDWEQATRNGDVVRLQEMIDRGADVDALDRYGQSALMLAALTGQTDIARALIDAGAALDRTAKYHFSALMIAAINGRTAIAELLIRAGADTGIRGTGAPGFQGKTALDFARHHGRDDIVRLLTRAQAP